MNYSEQAYRILDLIEATSVRFKPLDATLLAALATLYDLQPKLDQDMLVARVNNKVGKKLLTIATAFAERAINNNTANDLKLGLFCHYLEGFRVDPRENTRHLVLMSDAAQRLKMSLSDIFREFIQPMTNPNVRQAFEIYFSRAACDNQLARYGVEGVTVDSIFMFRQKSATTD